MAITRFEDLPSENSPINSENLNGNFDELGVKVGTSVDNNYRTNIIKSKNLFNKNSAITNYRLASDATLYADNGYFTSEYIEVKSNTNYIVNITPANTKRICFYDNAHTFLSNVDSTQAFTTTSSTKYVRFAGLTSEIDTIQLEQGSTATTYEPYVTPSINVDGEEIYSKPVVLYNNVDGSNENITLNDNSDNYKYIDIYYKQQDETYSFVRALPNTKVVLSIPHVTDNGYAIAWSVRNIKISGNKITTAPTNRYLNINVVSTNDLSGASQTNNVYITKVVGYK